MQTISRKTFCERMIKLVAKGYLVPVNYTVNK